MRDDDLDNLDDDIRELERELEREMRDMPGSDREDLQRAPHVAYVTLYTNEVEELAEFYETLFGFARRYESSSTIELQAGAIILMVSEEYQLVDTVGMTRVPAVADPRASHTLLVEDVDRSYEAALALGASGVKEPHDTEWGMRSCWLRDPAGHVIEIGRWLR